METSAVRGAPSAAALATPGHPSVVAWGAILAGAVAALATSIVLLSLGAGLGFASVSPWGDEGATAKTIGVAAVIWLVVVQWLSAALGGYLTGRLRLRWTVYTEDEVYFRDTAHGFLSWAVAVAFVALITASATTGILGTAAGGASMGAAQGAAANDRGMGYFADSLYRTTGPTPGGSAQTSSAQDLRGETTRILARGVSGDVNADDRAYLARLVSARTGMSQAEAQTRVDTVITQAKQAADTARKATAALAIATALSLAIGAFIAAVSAGLGGRLRDE
jgi:hypothetical protein